MLEFAGFHVRLCRTLLTHMLEFASLVRVSTVGVAERPYRVSLCLHCRRSRGWECGLPVVYSRRSREPRELATHSFDFGLQFRLWSDAEREIVPVRLQRANRVAREGGKTSF